jgi:hypothetical protein
MEWISASSPVWMIATVEMSHDFKSERKEIEVALVEYSYFIENKPTNNNLWVGDSGASCHMTCSLEGMKNIRKINSPIQVGTGDAVECTKVGDKSVCIVQEDGAVKDIVLKECKYVPDLFTNLFSIDRK